MRRHRPIARLAALAVLACAGDATAAVDRTTVACPIDGGEVEVTVFLSTNALRGLDRDLCPHADGDDEIRGAVAVCPRCGFAGTVRELKEGVSEEVAARVRKELKGADVLPCWERYAARARILEWSGKTPAVVGESWLRAAWCVRLEERPIADEALRAAADQAMTIATVSQFPNPSGTDPILRMARSLETLLENGGPVPDPTAAWYVAGRLWRSRGELDAAEVRFAKALAAGGALRAAIESEISRDRASMSLEREYLGKALARFRAALAAGETVPAPQRAMLAYLAAESARRARAFDEAHRLYKMARALSAGVTSGPTAGGGPNPVDLAARIEQGLDETAPRRKGKDR